MDGSIFIQEETRYEGLAIETVSGTVWVTALPSGTSAQKAELIALTKVLQLGKDRTINIYMDSCYAFAMAYAHRANQRERGLLTTEGKTIKNK